LLLDTRYKVKFPNFREGVFHGVLVCGVQLKLHNFGQWPMGIVSGASHHPKDVPFLREFWWGKYGLGAIEPPKTPISAIVDVE